MVAESTSLGSSPLRYRRILLKVSGEVLMGQAGFGIDMHTVEQVAREVAEISSLGVELCLVIGGGNIFRGLSTAARGMERASADYMGMLATVMNALAMQNALEKIGVDTRVQSAIPMATVCEPYIRRRALRHLEKGRVVIFAAGTGNPFFTTDTAAALRAIEIKADVLLKATKVEGVYSDDPKKVKGATKFSRISYADVLAKELKVMDSTAISLSKDNGLCIKIFDINCRGNIKRAVCGDDIGTLIDLKGGGS